MVVAKDWVETIVDMELPNRDRRLVKSSSMLFLREWSTKQLSLEDDVASTSFKALSADPVKRDPSHADRQETENTMKGIGTLWYGVVSF